MILNSKNKFLFQFNLYKRKLSVQANCVISACWEKPRLRCVEQNFEDSVVADFVVVVEAFQRNDERILEQVAVKKC